MREARAGAMVLLAIDHFLASCVQQNDTITADAKCTTIAPQQDHNSDTQWSDHFLTRCLWQKDVIRAHAKCQTHIADNAGPQTVGKRWNSALLTKILRSED